jgi:hypothetical protein
VEGYDPFAVSGPTGHMELAGAVASGRTADADGSGGVAPRGTGDDREPSTLWSEDACRDISADLLRLVATKGGSSDAVLDLLERYGVPAGVDVHGLARTVRERRDELANAVIPLPHPYDIELAVLRFERLLAQQP